jgi:hypothetical protein
MDSPRYVLNMPAAASGVNPFSGWIVPFPAAFFAVFNELHGQSAGLVSPNQG